jgi:hypothetical protein
MGVTGKPDRNCTDISTVMSGGVRTFVFAEP